jgi:hypothetical protein
MKREASDCFGRFRADELFVTLLLVFAAVEPGGAPSLARGGEANTGASDYAAYQKAAEAGDDSKASTIGDQIFAQLSRKYKRDAGFTAYKSKLQAAEFLAKQMQQQLRRATNKRMLDAGHELFQNNDQGSIMMPLSVAPAKRFYETSAALFSKPVRADNLGDEEKAFLARYYDLKLRLLTSEIAKAGQALAIAEPSFHGTHNYVLVLPLLHASKERSVNIEVLPRWMRRPSQLDVFSDSCLLHFGFPFHAMMVAKRSAEAASREFSELDFYRSAAAKCGTPQAHTAADCLQRAIGEAKGDAGLNVVLRFELVQLWLDSKNYTLAAGEARKIFETYPNHNQSARSIWLYYYALSRSNSAEEILRDVDKVIDDKRCSVYRPKLMYIKWWALRRERDQAARVAALEYQLLKQYGNDPMVAPILLSHATDQLAGQDYGGAYESLSELVEKFPSTKAALQAKRMLDKLKAMKGGS